MNDLYVMTRNNHDHIWSFMKKMQTFVNKNCYINDKILNYTNMHWLITNYRDLY